jgi:plastocyanin
MEKMNMKNSFYILCFLFAGLAASAPALAANHDIIEKDKKFSESEITVKVGDTITFKNQDDLVHNVKSTSAGNEFELPKQNPGKEDTATMKTPGEVKITCAIHPKMKLLVNVK